MTLPSLYSIDRVETLKQQMLAHPAHYTRGELRHFRIPGVYARELFMPAGDGVVGKVHLKDHLLMVLGDLEVYCPEGRIRLEGYHWLEIKAGTQRTLFARADTWLVGVHANPNNLPPDAFEAWATTDDLSRVQLPEGTCTSL